MVRVFRYRLYPTKGQEVGMHQTLDRLRELYNAALEERISAYRKQGLSLSCAQQQKELGEVKHVRPEFAAIHSQVLQHTLKRLDLAYRAFFRRVQAGEKPGFPRFKGRGRLRSFTYPQASCTGAKLVAGGKRVQLSGIGKVKVKLHRPLEERVKQVSVTLCGDGHWYVSFVCDDVPPKALPLTGKTVGLDLGISSFAALSDGTLVQNPRVYEKAQASLRREQRKLARRKRGSHRRRKQVQVVAKWHDRVARTRRDFHHKVASKLVTDFDAIAVEDLNVKGMAKGFLSKQIHDAAWAQFTTILASKAESAGRELFKVNPRGTSQRCSDCEREVRKGLHVRIHSCPHCGCVLDRDVNAAKNVQRLGHSRRGGESRKLSAEPRSPLLTPQA